MCFCVMFEIFKTAFFCWSHSSWRSAVKQKEEGLIFWPHCLNKYVFSQMHKKMIEHRENDKVAWSDEFVECVLKKLPNLNLTQLSRKEETIVAKNKMYALYAIQ